MDPGYDGPYPGRDTMHPPTASAADGLTRRQVLKRGAALGAASLWATPTLQLIRMSSARAAETSGSFCVTYCIKWDTGKQAWENLGQPNPQACLTCPEGALNELPPAELLQQFTVSGDPDIALTVRYPASCSLLVVDAADEFTGTWSGAAKCGAQGVSCNYVGPGDQELEDEDEDGEPDVGEFFTLEIQKCANGAEISHLELIIQCCSHDTDA
jgi:hypothetical protein